MTRECLIDLNCDLKTPVFRILQFDDLLNQLILNEIALVKPHMWDDPFEEFLSKQDFRGPKGECLTMRNFNGRFFCQCWTLENETDFMWRVYSPNKRGVKIRTSLRQLLEEFTKSKAINDLFRIVSIR